MNDKMTVMGVDGKAKYELTPDNNVIDLRDHCQCTEEGRHWLWDGEQQVCQVCNLPITQTL